MGFELLEAYLSEDFLPQRDEIVFSWEKRLTAIRHKMYIAQHGATTHKSRLKEDFLASSTPPHAQYNSIHTRCVRKS